MQAMMHRCEEATVEVRENDGTVWVDVEKDGNKFVLFFDTAEQIQDFAENLWYAVRDRRTWPGEKKEAA